MTTEELKNKIIEASQAYYSGEAIMEDSEFEKMIKELRAINPNDSLLNKISFGYDINKDTTGEKVKHKYRLVGSLKKINKETISKHFTNDDELYIITSKFDGGSVVAYYDGDGKLDKILTRGDGEIGIDVTLKLKSKVPRKISLHNCAVRGEITMKNEIFKRFFPDAASPRNSAMGIVGKDCPTEAEIDMLTFVAYSAYGNEEIDSYTKNKMIEYLSGQGFTAPKRISWNSLYKNDVEDFRGMLNPELPSDGLVFTDNKNPLVEIAYKFEAEAKITTVTNIEWETSRLGNIIPTVHFVPVKLSGATISKCSGFNAAWIASENIGIGAKIEVHRANEVIPNIKSIIEATKATIPINCPCCVEPIKWNGVHITCKNPSCIAQQLGKLMLFYETLFRIDSLGIDIMHHFFGRMDFREVKDLFQMRQWREHIKKPEFTEHEIQLLDILHHKLYKEKVNPENFLAAFGLPAVGQAVSKKLTGINGIKWFFETMTETDLGYLCKGMSIPNPALDSIRSNFSYMKSIYLNIHQGFIEKTAHKMKVVITGKLSKPRESIAHEFATRGIQILSSLNKETDYLITEDPDSGSNKNEKAKKLGVKVISETDFRKII